MRVGSPLSAGVARAGTFGRGGVGSRPMAPVRGPFPTPHAAYRHAQLNGPLTPSDLPLVHSLLRACSAANGSRTSSRFSCANHVTWNSGHRMTRHSKP